MHSEMLHLHNNVEIIVVSCGTVICSAGEDNFELRAGDVCLINHNHLHRICSNGDSKCAYKVLNVGMSLLMQNPLIYEKYLKPMIDDSSFSHISFDGTSGSAGKIASLIADIESLQHNMPSGYELKLIALLHLLFHEIYLVYIDEPKKPPMDNNAFIQKKMIEFIYNHFNEEIILDDIARAGNVSRSQCAKIFNKYAQLSPINFLNKHRLEISLHLLRSTTTSVSEIAQSCGFFDQSYFNRLFLREYGCTPLSYRKSGWKSPSIS
ncbi:AraC family transcriptional regulator [Solobacterium moorei]|uniref:Transcriptional regulator, AraC family n=1 Tax=Solobacterium moorei F0204 TaxID=706433 RepID=E7MNJ1_9FIRM|nr:AraC family transcriptional regulator [Solobacterium moorei]EFW24329.1 transcriptional regulator, AraC family [Solobacterium moorei F0204]